MNFIFIQENILLLTSFFKVGKKQSIFNIYLSELYKFLRLTLIGLNSSMATINHYFAFTPFN